MYIVYAADPDLTGIDESDIFFIRLVDAGLNWSAPIKINDDTTKNDQVLPWMEVKSNGIIEIAWYDRRNDPSDHSWDVYFTSISEGRYIFQFNEKPGDRHDRTRNEF